jgi:hypothetical protein
VLLSQRQNQILTGTIRFGKLFKIAKPCFDGELRNQDTAELTWEMLPRRDDHDGARPGYKYAGPKIADISSRQLTDSEAPNATTTVTRQTSERSSILGVRLRVYPAQHYVEVSFNTGIALARPSFELLPIFNCE